MAREIPWRLMAAVALTVAAVLAGGARSARAEQSAAEQDKALVLRLMDAMAEARRTGDTSAIDELVSPDFVQHQQGIPAGREGLKQFLASGGVPAPGGVIMIGGPGGAPPANLPTAVRLPVTVGQPTVEFAIAEGDRVAVYSTAQNTLPNGDTITVDIVDIFRVADSLVVEHWGVTGGGAPPAGFMPPMPPSP